MKGFIFQSNIYKSLSVLFSKPMSGTTEHKKWLVRMCALSNRQENLFKDKNKSRWCYVWLFFIHLWKKQKNRKETLRCEATFGVSATVGPLCVMYRAGRRFSPWLGSVWRESWFIQYHWVRTRCLHTAYLSQSRDSQVQEEQSRAMRQSSVLQQRTEP